MSKHPIFKLSGGLLMGVVGGIMFISSIVIVSSNAQVITQYAADRQSADEIAKPPAISASRCVTHINDIGLSASASEKGGVLIEPTGIVDRANPLEAASLAASACPGFHLTNFCMGADCEGGLEMELGAHQ